MAITATSRIKSTLTTLARVKKLAEMAAERGELQTLRDLTHVLAIHVRKTSGDELGDEIEEFLIGHTTPDTTTPADPGTPNKGA